jgi:hypothetical protein
VESAAKDRLTEIGSTVRRVGLQLQNRDRGFSEDRQFGPQTLREGSKVKWSVYRVACLSVGELKIQHVGRGEAMTGSRQGYSRGCEVTEVETASWNER